jgi:predicted PurR-regulated permease PerM
MKLSSTSITTGTIFRVVLIGIFFYTLFILKDLVLTIISAVVVASAVEPAAVWFEKRRVPRTLAVVFVYLITALIFGGIFLYFIPILFKETLNILGTFPTLVESVLSVPIVESFNTYTTGFSGTSLSDVLKTASSALSGATLSFITVASSLFGGILSLILVIVISFYLAVQKNGVAHFLHIVTPSQHEDYIVDLWKRSQRKIGLWFQGQLLLAALVGIMTYLFLAIAGIPNALFLAVLTGVMELIPVIGPIIAMVPAISFAFFDGGVTSAGIVFVVYVIIQQLESNLFHPLVVKKIVGIPALVAIIALIVGAQLAGFIGILLSVPIAAAIMEYLNDVEKGKSKALEVRRSISEGVKK